MAHSKLKKSTGVLAVLLALATSAAQAVPFYWTDWSGGDLDPTAGFQGQGTITTPTSTVTVTYTNANGIAFFQTGGGTDYWTNGFFGTTRNAATSPYTSSTVDNIPTGTDIIGLQYAGSQTLLFSQTVANPVFSYVSLNGNGYQFFNQDFDILSQGGVDGNDCGYWGCGQASKAVISLGGGNFAYELIANNVGGTEPHGTIRFRGAFDSLSWTSLSNEYWNGFTVGVQGTAQEVSLPEPGSLALLGLGLAGLALRRRRKS